MTIVSSFYCIHQQRSAQSPAEAEVVFMSPSAKAAMQALEHLSKRPVTNMAWCVGTLEGRGKTTDGKPSLRSYSQSGNDSFWRVEHTTLAPALVPALAAAARTSQARLGPQPDDAVGGSRRRLRT
jgi:hypothetical protein